MVKSPLSSAGDAGWIPGQGPKIPHAADCVQKFKNKSIKLVFKKRQQDDEI